MSKNQSVLNPQKSVCAKDSFMCVCAQAALNVYL